MTAAVFEAVPSELKACPQWLLWRRALVGVKFTKQPISAHTGQLASVTRSTDWTTFDHAYATLQQHAPTGAVHGLGFVFGYNSGVTGVDLDKVFSEAGAILDERAHAMADALNSYTELSPSGTGLHVLVRANFAGGRRRENVELYGQERFFTVTGNTYGHPRPLNVRQAEIDQLAREIDDFRASRVPVLDWSTPDSMTDHELFQMATRAENGDKFFKLYNGQWQQFYGSQSEADYALINIIAFYTDSPAQVNRLFLSSALGQREKAQRHGYVVGMVARSFDNKVPLVQVPALPQPMAAIAQVIAQEAAADMPDSEPEDIEEQAALADNPYSCPDGLLGELAAWLWQQSRWPMEELCLVGALGIIAGVCGRQFQYDGSGLNLYMMLLAGTGAGKEALSAGVSKVFEAVTAPPDAIPMPGQPAPLGFDAAVGFMGPTQLTGKGLLRAFNEGATAKTNACVSVVPEFSQTLTQMADPRAHAGLKEFQQVLLDFYMKSSAGSRYAGSMNSDKAKDVRVLRSPSFTLVCEGTPERFWRAMNEHMVTDGLMSRFIVFERAGYDMKRNEAATANKEVPAFLKDKMTRLCQIALELQTQTGGDRRINVAIDADALEYSKELEAYYRQRGISGSSEVHKVLWFRAHQNCMRMAAIAAIGVNPVMPTITAAQVAWANKIVYRQVTLLVGKFRRGEIGEQDTTEREQHDTVRKLLARWQELDSSRVPAQFREAREAGLVPLSWLSQNTLNRAAFKNGRITPTLALHNALKHFVSTGVLSRATLANKAGEYYRIG